MVDVVTKWGLTGLLEDLSKVGQIKMAQLLESEAQYLISRSSGSLDHTLGKMDIADKNFQSVALLLVRRVFEKFVEEKYFQVMELPSQLDLSGNPIIAKTAKLHAALPGWLMDEHTQLNLDIMVGDHLTKELIESFSYWIKPTDIVYIYTPIMTSPAIQSPHFTPRRGFLTRFAKVKLVEEKSE